MLDIVIVNWNSGDQLRACLQSIATTRSPDVGIRRVVVVDNGSTDGSTRNLPGELPVVVIENVVNRGFAAACNQGARASDARYVLFLNPDTVLLPSSLSVPVAFMESPGAKDVGISGIQLVDESGKVARSCSRYPTTSMFLCKMLGLENLLPPGVARHAMTEWDHASDRDVDQVIGAFFLCRRRLFDDLGGFDERFFVYFEEVDFSLRASARGFRTRFLSGARAVHRGGGCSDQVRARRLAYSLRSRLEYARKNFSPASAAVLIASSLTVEPVTRLAASVLRGPRGSSREILEGFGSVWASTPAWLLRRPIAGRTPASAPGRSTRDAPKPGNHD